MTDDDRSLDRVARSWLEVGPTRAPEVAVQAALDRILTTPQERDLGIPWRFPSMTTPARLAAAAVIGVLLVGGFLFIARPSQEVGGPSPVPSMSAPAIVPASSAAAAPSDVASAAPPTPTVSPLEVPALTQTYTSTRNGFTIKYPNGWTVTHAVQPWAQGSEIGWGDPALDTLTGTDLRFVGASQPQLADQPPAAWYRAVCQLGGGPACETAPTGWEPITIDGQPGYLDDVWATAQQSIVPGGHFYDAVIVLEGRGYEFTLDGNVDRGVVAAFLATIHLTPQVANDLPRLTGRFTSPTNGYSIGLADGWTTAPAAARWTGVNNDNKFMDSISVTADSGTGVTSQALGTRTFQQFVDAFYAGQHAAVGSTCDGGPPSGWPTITIGDQTGVLEVQCGSAEALVAAGGRAYLFELGLTPDSRPSFGMEGWQELLRSVKLDPASAK